ncbi:MAG: fumarylacetoacetate hydrolase family protein [Candidatus Ratteibacteria bacterium]|nr:fumarylacetoacetate hydrolase family protein [Candidatus Ratteibacteria bacterium]
MRYVRVSLDEREEKDVYGILEGDSIQIIKASPLSNTIELSGKQVSLNDVKKFLPPVEPPNIVALGLNYKEHAEESRMELPPAPVIFLKATSAITGHLSPIVLPKEAPDFVDYEAELVIVIKKRAKNIRKEDASRYILGYTCGNDVSARDCQMKIDKQWARAKSFDSFAPIGPWIETDIKPDNLNIYSRLNGVIMQDANTSDMIFSVADIVSYLSRQMTLLPGTLIMTGTPSGVGFARSPAVFLREGDTIEVEIEGIGILKNPVIKE